MDYKEILKGIVNIINATEKSDIGFANICTFISENCPELKESEDERIKGAIIHFISHTPTVPKGIISKEIMIAWLEEQGKKDKLIQELGEYKVKYIQETLGKALTMNNKDDERLRKTTIAFLKEFADKGYENAIECIDWLESKKKPEDKVEPKFKNGQWIVWRDKCYKVNDNGCGYELVDQDGLSTSLEYGTIDENAHIWDITKDAKDGDVLVYHNTVTKIIMLFKSWVVEREAAYTHFHIFDNDYRVNDWCDCGKNAHPATKEQRDALEMAMTNAGYRWNKEELKLEKI